MTTRTAQGSNEIGVNCRLQDVFEEPVSNISTEISPLDTMYEGSREHYVSVGHSALRCVRLALLAAGKTEAHNVLDFACGFGRVLRVLKAALPSARFSCCDVSTNAIEFCSKQFGARPIHSGEDFGNLNIGGAFDLIWCGSLMTQLIPSQFTNCLDLFQSLLSPGGVMVFTTHGKFVAERIRAREFNYGLHEEVCSAMIADYDRVGYGYGDYPAHVLPQVGVKRYGVSVAKPSWVLGEIDRRPELRILNFTERAWDNHQDSVACVNVKGL